MKISSLKSACVLSTLFSISVFVSAEETRDVPPALFEGKAISAVLQELKNRPAREPAEVFLLGTTEFLGGVERLCQRFHQLGLNYQLGRQLPVPFLRLQLPPHPNPPLARAEDVRAALDEFYATMNRVEETLRPIRGKTFRLEVPLGQMALDFDGDGSIGERESFLTLYRQFNRRAAETASQSPNAAAKFDAVFDGADVHWLIAYTHFLRGSADLMLAHDGTELFNTVGQLFFVRADTSLGRPGLALRDDTRRQWTSIADAIGLLHQLRLPVQDAQRLARARIHWISMIGESRAMLAALEAETDNDREWLPNPRQNSALGVALAQEQIDGWRLFLAEMEVILEGKKLLPHWRFATTHGFNVKRFLTQAKTTDLVLLLQGSAAVPYIEAGECTSDATWREITRLFQGNFIGFAIWIN
jgi:hypothetical protein